jgi:hypothetical protein
MNNNLVHREFHDGVVDKRAIGKAASGIKRQDVFQTGKKKLQCRRHPHGLKIPRNRSRRKGGGYGSV